MTTAIELLGTTNSTMSTSRGQRIVPKSPDAFNECNVISRFVLTLVQSNWDIFSPEDVFAKRGLKARIQNAIVKVVEAMLNTRPSTDEESIQEAEEEGEESHNDTNLHLVSSPTSRAHSHGDSIENNARLCNIKTQPAVRRNCVLNMLFPLETYRLLDDRGWLPESHRSFRLLYELNHNHLIVHMASPAHDAVANAWNIRIALWSTNGGIGVTTLRQLGQGRMTCLVCKLTKSRVPLDCGIRKVA